MADSAQHSEGGFTLLEILVVLIILALLIAIVTPALAAYLGRGEKESFDADKRSLQAAVDAYYTGEAYRDAAGRRRYPTDWNGGIVSGDVNAVISMPYLLNESLVRHSHSAGSENGIDQEPGSYIWVVEGTTGRVQGCYAANSTVFDHAATACDEGYGGVYP